MTKKPFIVFGLVFVLMVVLIPFWAFHRSGDPDSRSAGQEGRMEVPHDLKKGQALFDTNCGTCHTLYAAGTDGDFGPNLDQQLAPAGTPTGPGASDTIAGTKTRVLNAIDKGYDDTSYAGRMPPGIVVGPEADSIAEFVAQTAGRG